ncbi:MAG: class I SAM-dependent methyltransferase [Ignavibacteriaceae bacterium]|nr:class I SAM-dependent methyltransferase [Ignavibacteriaceae bacterium]
MHDKIQKEKEFHNSAFSDGRRANLNGIYAIIQPSIQKYIDLISRECFGKSVLEYGCGPGSQAVTIAGLGAKVTGIDISEVAIEQARDKAIKQGLEIEFLVENAEDFNLGEGRFDSIIGSAIIHHLDIDKAFTAITRALKPDGRCVFFEPLGHNIFINLFRKLTPGLRTDDEHPLTKEELARIRQYFKKAEFTYFHLASLFLVPLTKFSSFSKFLGVTEKIDKFLFKILPFIKNKAWIVVMELSEPVKKQSNA